MKEKIFEVNGYKVTYGDDYYIDEGFPNDDWISLDSYIDDDMLFKTYKYYSSPDETESERNERILREKAIARENKINQILGE